MGATATEQATNAVITGINNMPPSRQPFFSVTNAITAKESQVVYGINANKTAYNMACRLLSSNFFACWLMNPFTLIMVIDGYRNKEAIPGILLA